jgi:1-pyrroline-5-carboxylate dehydrogenase
MANAQFRVPPPVNEPVKNYAPGSPEKTEIKAELAIQWQKTVEIPLVIGGEHVHTAATTAVTSPQDHGHVIAKSAQCHAEHVKKAIHAAVETQKSWNRLPWEERAAVFLKAADLLCTKYRSKMNAATMIGQSKTVYQAEIDAACELADFWRFNVHFMSELYADQPISSPGIWNRTIARGLEGFVFAVTPFNFSSIAVNLATAPALMGCGVVWKPAPTAMLSAWVGMEILEEAGLPPGVVNMVSGDASMIGELCLQDPHLAGVHFTGSTATFNRMWQTVGQNISKYKSYPRIVGETGGKDFIFAHASADVEGLVTALIRGAFEFQGQKCSAASRAYIPKSLWPKVKEQLLAETASLRVGDPRDFSNFMGAVIDERAFQNIKGYIDHARSASNVKILAGGQYDCSKGWFVQPTVIETEDPAYRTMCEEIFGPVLTIFVYDDRHFQETLTLCEKTSPYALTGAIFARDRGVIHQMSQALENAAGNFYVNDKCTGAVVGQQPFGGGRASGTNDKAGSKLNLARWMSVRTVKEVFVAPTRYEYPFMKES